MPAYSVVPFVGLLLTIAIAPLVAPHFWERNTRKALVSFLFALPVAVYLVVNGWPALLLHTGMEYFSFIVLLGALFTVSGGILLTGDIRATPATNTLFLFVGGVIANLIGTTGASMILIRPMLRINSERTRTSHIPIFFIFVVSNIGGCLTPLGDPPLFLGYLRGVPFTWTLRLLPEWTLCLVSILTIFYVYDSVQYRREPVGAIEKDRTQIEPIRLRGNLNFLFLLGIMAAVLIESPIKASVPGVEHVPLKEILMIEMAVLSYLFTPRELRERNGFTFSPIVEVAVLFAGIFVAMVPALRILEARGTEFGIDRPWQFFWLTGILSSFLDNAPTYLTYASTASALFGTSAEHLDQLIATTRTVNGFGGSAFLAAIACGAVFMGANTYIGNGPNFMVKSISEEAGYKMPSFFGYMLYSICILIPLFVLLCLVFFA